MPTQEDRLAALERKIASLELEMLYERRKAEETTPSEQTYNAKEVNHHLTMLLGIASGQERDINIVKSDVSAIKDRLESMQQQFTAFEGKVEQRFATLESKVEQRFVAVEGKLDQVLQILTTLPGTDS